MTEKVLKVHVGIILKVNSGDFRYNGDFTESNDCMTDKCVNYLKRINTPYCAQCGEKPKYLLRGTMSIIDAFDIFMRRTENKYAHLIRMPEGLVDTILFGETHYHLGESNHVGLVSLHDIDYDSLILNFNNEYSNLREDMIDFFGSCTIHVNFGITHYWERPCYSND